METPGEGLLVDDPVAGVGTHCGIRQQESSGSVTIVQPAGILLYTAHLKELFTNCILGNFLCFCCCLLIF